MYFSSLEKGKGGEFMIEILFLLLMISVFYHSRQGNKVNWKENSNEKNFLFFFYPMAFFLYTKSQFLFHKRDEKLKAQIGHLCFLEGQEIEREVVLFRCKQFSIGIVAVFLCLLCSFTLSMKQEREEQSLWITRNSVGKGEKQVPIQLEKEGEGEKTEYVLTVGEQQYTREQWEQQLEKAKRYVEKTMLGDNHSFDCVQSPLVFQKRMPDSAIKITYTPKEHKWIEDTGDVRLEGVGEEGVITEVIVGFQYQEEKVEVSYPIRLLPKEKTEEERQYETAIEQLKQEEQKNPYEEKVKLPDKIGDYLLHLSKKDNGNKKGILLLFLFAGSFYVIRLEESMKEKEKERIEQLLKDYPEFIHQLVLLLGAGMTLKGVFIKIAKNYEQRKNVESIPIRYLYEEVLLAVYEFQAGISEEAVYRNFGMRVGIPIYKKVVELLIQNLKKGTGDLLFMLQREENAALEMRKEQAKRLGEEAGTKMLLPMIVLMGVVLLFVLYPAMIQFQI